MTLRSQDIMALLKIIALDKSNWSYRELAAELFMSLGEVHGALKRSLAGSLAVTFNLKRNELPQVNKGALLKFIQYGVPHVFPAERGTLTIGMPTGFASPALQDSFNLNNPLEQPVWPDAQGVKGFALKPLYKSAVAASRKDKRLYDMLALVDAVRDGKTRERKIAVKKLSEYFEL